MLNIPPVGVTLNPLMEKAERIQYQAALAVADTWQSSCRSKLYEELGWEALGKPYPIVDGADAFFKFIRL